MKYIGLKSLFCEKNSDELSLGRITFWILFGTCMHFWYTKPWNEFPPSLVDAFMYVLAYNLFKKGINVVSARAESFFESRGFSSSYATKSYNDGAVDNNQADLNQYNLKDYNQ